VTSPPLKRFASYTTVGAVGFIVDAGILSALVHVWEWPHYTARALSFAAAVTVTWALNRRWVFARTHDATREYGAYFGVQAVGAFINLGTYALVILAYPPLARLPVLPFTVGAALGFAFNYYWTVRWVYAAGPSVSPLRSEQRENADAPRSASRPAERVDRGTLRP
jgi:Predicted membrane protein